MSGTMIILHDTMKNLPKNRFLKNMKILYLPDSLTQESQRFYRFRFIQYSTNLSRLRMAAWMLPYTGNPCSSR